MSGKALAFTRTLPSGAVYSSKRNVGAASKGSSFLGKILFLALALFAFCTWNSPTVAVAGQDSATNLPHGWQKLDAKYFSIYAPPGWKFRKLVGIDSYVGEFVGDGIRLTFDYGQYSNSLPADAKEPAYAVVEEQVGGHLAKIVNPKRPDHGVTAIFFRDVGDTNGLYIDGRDLSASQQKTALMMFRTIRFRAALTQR